MLSSKLVLLTTAGLGITSTLHWIDGRQSIQASPAQELAAPQARTLSSPSDPTPARRPSRQVVWVDFDSDGHLDAHVLRGAESHLLRNDGSGAFENVTASAGLAELGPIRFALWEDFDGNGTLDLFAGRIERSGALFANLGDGTLLDVTESSGLEALEPAHAGSWFDFDADGWKDLWIEHAAGATLLRNASGVGFGVVELDLPAGPPLASPAPTGLADAGGSLAGAGTAPVAAGPGTSLAPSGAPQTLLALPAPGTLSPAGAASLPLRSLFAFDDEYVNDNRNEVDSADVLDGSLLGADVSTTSGDVTHTGGNVGIGTSSPSAALDVAGTTTMASNSSSIPALTVDGGAFFKDDYGALDSTVGAGIRVFTESDTRGHIYAYDYARLDDHGVPEPAPIDLILQQPGGRVGIGTTTPQATLDVKGLLCVVEETGKVGIGTASPATRLDVNGAITIRGGADIVERFDVAGGAIEPGTVLVIDPENAGDLMLSNEPYDLRVAGIVSGAGGVKAGICLGQEGVMDGDTPVAMTGRVYVKASTENGAIRPGDRLTTAALAGHAMKVTDATRGVGAVIGKAMTSLDDETGLVLVLVNLQ